MISDEQITPFLVEAGDNGLSLDKLARHVFNSLNTLFNPLEFEAVKRQVDAFIRRNCHDSYSLLEKVGRYPAKYRINPYSAQASQLLLNFTDEEVETPTAEDTADDLSLFLEF